ncbi:hypothetical protein HZH66_007099 [Vespula vulgaris]|uniref:Uncharacterized protein n=1 Tax=Vespula vulgaris TaxID=7454 RepID=A0A834JYZ3_VESVU|nr:hypothetical protein HZH66_007099 [Vespula vulgaris]
MMVVEVSTPKKAGKKLRRFAFLWSASSEGQYRARHDLFTGVIAHFRSSVPVLRCFEFSSCYNNDDDDDDDDDDDNDDGDDGGGVDNDDDDDDDDDAIPLLVVKVVDGGSGGDGGGSGGGRDGDG